MNGLTIDGFAVASSSNGGLPEEIAHDGPLGYWRRKREEYDRGSG